MAKYQAFSTTVIGSSHTKHGKECQDYSAHFGGGQKDGAAIAVVADGHGADECFRSGTGARFAGDVAKAGIWDFIKHLDERPGFMQKPAVDRLSAQQITKELRERLVKLGFISGWHRAVQDDYTRNPFTQAELAAAGEKYGARFAKSENLHKAYGTTLIACAVTQKYWFGIHIGDGRLMALYADGTFDQPVPWDDKCFLNVTTSISDEDAAEKARVYFAFHAQKAPPVAVFLCSDGVDDNYPVEDNERYLFKLYREIALTFAHDGFDAACPQIADLAHAFATKGKGDDTSIAGVVDMDGIKRAAQVWQQQITGGDTEVAAAQPAHSDAPEPPPSGQNAQSAPAATPRANFEPRSLLDLQKVKEQSLSLRIIVAVAVCAALVAAGVTVIGGIMYRRLGDEHARLRLENSRIQNELADSQAQLQGKAAEAESLRQENAQLKAQDEAAADGEAAAQKGDE